MWAHKRRSKGLGDARENLEWSMIDLIPYFGENNLEPNVPVGWLVYVAVYIYLPDNHVLFSLHHMGCSSSRISRNPCDDFIKFQVKHLFQVL